MRTNVVLDEQLVNEAFALTHVRTKKRLLHLALQELVRAHKKKNLLDLAGKIAFRDDFDHKAARELRRGPR